MNEKIIINALVIKVKSGEIQLEEIPSEWQVKVEEQLNND